MKNRIKLASVLFPLAVFVSCEQAQAPEEADKYEQVSVTSDIIFTKTSIDGSVPLWELDDKVAFFTSDLILCPPFTSGTGGSSRTTFSGLKPSGSSLAYALYPYDGSSSYSKSGIMTSLPGKQDGTLKSAIMVSAGNETDGFEFANVCSIIKLNIPVSLDIVKVEIYRTDKVSGTLAVEPRLELFEVKAGEPTCAGDRRAAAVSDTPFSGDVYIAVIPSTSTDLNLALTNSSGEVSIISKPLPSQKPYTSGTIKDLGSAASLTFGPAAELADDTYSQL